MRDKWSSRGTFILAAIGSAVGLGNAWRFPGLAAKHGGGAFLFVYILAMLCIGIPLLIAGLVFLLMPFFKGKKAAPQPSAPFEK